MEQEQSGQHILIDKEILKREIQAALLSKKDNILEIGAGTGVLTKELAENSGKVLAFEIDKKFKPFLDKLNYENLEIVYDDALIHDWQGYTKIVSNIPYFLSEPIILKAIQSEIPFLVLIVGETFKEKLESDEKIGQIARLFYNTETICKVEKSSFSPQPRTASFLIKLTKKEATKPEQLLQKIVLKNGKLKNAILFSLVESGKTKNQARELIEKMKINSLALEKPTIKLTGKLLLRLKDELSKSF